MSKFFARLAASAILATVVSVTATRAAESDPDNGPSDPCLKQVYDLADTAQAAQLPIATMEKLDGLFTKMEQHCKAKDQARASTVAADIKKVIETEK